MTCNNWNARSWLLFECLASFAKKKLHYFTKVLKAAPSACTIIILFKIKLIRNRITVVLCGRRS